MRPQPPRLSRAPYLMDVVDRLSRPHAPLRPKTGDDLIDRDSAGDRERAVATPILAALSRHAALRVPLGSASLQRSPPPVLLTSDAMQLYDAM